MSMDGIIGHLKGISRALNLTGEEYFAERILMQVEELEKQAALQAGAGDGERTGTVSDIPDSELLRRVVASLARVSDRKKRPLWVQVMDLTCLGSTYSAQLCHRFGYDPDKYLKQKPNHQEKSDE